MPFSLCVVVLVFLETSLQLKGANLFTQHFCKLKPQCQKCKTLPSLLYWFPADTRILLWWPAFSVRDKNSTGHVAATCQSFTSLFTFLSPITFRTAKTFCFYTCYRSVSFQVCRCPVFFFTRHTSMHFL